MGGEGGRPDPYLVRFFTKVVELGGHIGIARSGTGQRGGAFGIVFCIWWKCQIYLILWEIGRDHLISMLAQASAAAASSCGKGGLVAWRYILAFARGSC